MMVSVSNWQVLIDGLDGIVGQYVAFEIEKACCMANAYLGLNPETGEPTSGTPASNDDGTDTGGTTSETPVTPPAPCNPMGGPLLDVSGNEVVCEGEYLPSEGFKKTYITHKSDFQANIYCVPGFTYAYALGSTPDGPPAGYDFTNLNDPNHPDVAVVNDAPFACPSDVPFDATIEAFYEGEDYFPFIVHCCEAIPPDPIADSDSDACSGFTGTTNDMYYKMWQDYLCCYKKNQRWYLGLYGFQLVAGIAAAVQGTLTYNKILDKSFDYSCELVDNARNLRQCTVEMLGDGTEENPGVLKQCQAELLEDHVGRIGVINGRNTFACDAATDMWDCYTQTFQPLEKQYASGIADQLFQLIQNGTSSSETLLEQAANLDAVIDECLLPQIKDKWVCLMESAKCPTDNLNAWRAAVVEMTNRVDNHVQNIYQANDETMVPAIQKMAECLAHRVCEMRCWLMECAQHDEDTYNADYRAHEGKQAASYMQVSNRSAEKLYDSLQWLDCNIPAAMELFHCYSKGMLPTNDRLFQNASELAPEIVCCYEWFQNNATEYKDQWTKAYKDPELAFVRSFFEGVQKLVCKTFDYFTDLEKWTRTDRERYDRYQEIASELTPEIVRTGAKANELLMPFNEWWQDRAKQFMDIWQDNWWECELREKQKHDAVWDTVNPLEKLAQNAEHLQDMSLESKAVFMRALGLTQQQLEKACEDPEFFDYCIEGAAVAHVQQLSGYEQENIIRCGSRFSPGATEEALIRMKAQMARSEGAVYALTERWKWQANRFLEDRQYNRKLGMVDTLNGFGALSVSASEASSTNHERLLTRVRAVTALGQMYTDKSRDSSTLAMSGYQNHIGNMLSMLGIWQNDGQLATANMSQLQSAANQAYSDARALIGTGQQWTSIAGGEKSKAVDVAQGSIDLGMRLTQIGQGYLQQAEAMNQERASIAGAAGGLGAEYAKIGHSLHQSAAGKMDSAMARSIEGTARGLQATEIGASLQATAIKEENVTTLNAIRHMQLGLDAQKLGLNFIEEISQTFTQSHQQTGSAVTGLLNLLKHSQNSQLLSMSASESCFKQQFEMLCKGKNYAQKNFQLYQDSLNRNSVGTTLNQLRDEASDSVAGGLGAFGNAAENLIQLNNPTPPIPQGNGIFGNVIGSGLGVV